MIPAGPPSSLPVLQPPTLCEAGPCRNFHRVASVMDVAEPLDSSSEPSRRQITRACYPASGIELELGETPVLQCSRWEPDNEQGRLDALRIAFMRTADGKTFTEKVHAFEEAEAEAAREEEIASAMNTDKDGKPLAQIDQLLADAKHDFDDADLDALEDSEGSVTP